MSGIKYMLGVLILALCVSESLSQVTVQNFTSYAKLCSDCNSTANADCNQKTNYVLCSCKSGFLGDGLNCTKYVFCDSYSCCPQGYTWSSVKKQCLDNNECSLESTHKCLGSAYCYNKNGVYLCNDPKNPACPTTPCDTGYDCDKTVSPSGAVSLSCVDPCGKYTQIDGSNRLYTINSTRRFSNDKYLFGWHRYNNGLGLKVGCVGTLKCGSLQPLTLSSQPTPNGAIQSLTLTNNALTGCTTGPSILGKACPGGYYVYKFNGLLNSDVYCTEMPPIFTFTTTTVTTPTTISTSTTSTTSTTTTTPPPTTTTPEPTTTTTEPTTTTTTTPSTTSTTAPTTEPTTTTTTTTPPTTITTAPTTESTTTTTTTLPTTSTTVPTTELTTTTTTTTLPTTSTTAPITEPTTTTTTTTTTLPTTSTTASTTEPTTTTSTTILLPSTSTTTPTAEPTTITTTTTTTPPTTSTTTTTSDPISYTITPTAQPTTSTTAITTEPTTTTTTTTTTPPTTSTTAPITEPTTTTATTIILPTTSTTAPITEPTTTTITLPTISTTTPTSDPISSTAATTTQPIFSTTTEPITGTTTTTPTTTSISTITPGITTSTPKHTTSFCNTTSPSPVIPTTHIYTEENITVTTVKSRSVLSVRILSRVIDNKEVKSLEINETTTVRIEMKTISPSKIYTKITNSIAPTSFMILVGDTEPKAYSNSTDTSITTSETTVPNTQPFTLDSYCSKPAETNTVTETSAVAGNTCSKVTSASATTTITTTEEVIVLGPDGFSKSCAYF